MTSLQFLTDTGFTSWSSDEIQRRWLAFAVILEAQFGAKKGSFEFLVEPLSTF